MKTKLTLALAAFLTGTAFGSMPAVLPEFKNEKQLAEWREEMAAKHATTSTSDVRSSALDVPSAFYTGKPYIEATGTYAFKYRSYNPELARWTSEDPSGFPDGANQNFYAPSPTTQFDPTGCAKMTSYDGTIIWYDGTPRPKTVTENFDDYYSDVNYKPVDFSGFSTAFSSASSGTSISLVRNYNHGDAYAIGRGNYHLDGTVTTNASGAKIFNGTVTLENDTFDFNPDPSRTWYNNALTWLLANTAFNPSLGGSSFDLTFSGSKSVTYE